MLTKQLNVMITKLIWLCKKFFFPSYYTEAPATFNVSNKMFTVEPWKNLYLKTYIKKLTIC